MASVAREGILVVGPAWIGDMVLAQSLFMTLKQRFPKSPIDVLAPAWSEPLLARMPEVNSGIVMPLDHGELGFRTRWRLGHRLRHRYRQAIVLPRSWKSALVPFFAQIPQRTGYRGEYRYALINDVRHLDKSRLTRTVERFVALGLGRESLLPATEIPEPRLRVDPQNQQRLLGRLALNLREPVVALIPGAEYGPAKRWPVDRYGALAIQLLASGRQVWVFGSVHEQSLGEEVVRIAGKQVINLCGRTRLEEAVDLLALVDTAVTNDSGLMHLAAAVGVKIIAIYGSSSPDYTPPLTGQAQIAYLRLSCSPCFERVCPLGHTNCLNHITVDDIRRRIL